MSKQVGGFFKFFLFLWPFQKSWTLLGAVGNRGGGTDCPLPIFADMLTLFQSVGSLYPPYYSLSLPPWILEPSYGPYNGQKIYEVVS